MRVRVRVLGHRVAHRLRRVPAAAAAQHVEHLVRVRARA